MNTDIYTLLKADHAELKEWLTELCTLEENDDYRFVLIENIASSLIPHSRAEESVFYNAIRASDADSGGVMHAFKEHMEAEGLLRVLQVKDKSEGHWKNTALKLKEGVEHHIQEEESKIFAIAQKIFTEDEAAKIGEAFLKLKAEVSDHGFVQNSFDLVANLMPPRFVERVKGLGSVSGQQ